MWARLIRYYFDSAWLPFVILLLVGVAYRVLSQLPPVLSSPSLRLDVDVSSTIAAVVALIGIGVAAAGQLIRLRWRQGLLNLLFLALGAAPFWLRLLGISPI